MARTWTAVVADIDEFVTESLSAMLEQHGYRTRIAPPTHAAVRNWIRKYGADFCVVDIALRDGAGAGAIEDLVAEFPSTKVIIRTADTSSTLMREALAAGAAGYVHKSRSAVVLLDAIGRVADGEVVVEGTFAPAIPTQPHERVEFHRMVEALTPRQRECLDMICEGKGTFAMAVELGVSTMTVRTHVQAVLAKLGVRSRLEAVSLVAKHQLPEMT